MENKKVVNENIIEIDDKKANISNVIYENVSKPNIDIEDDDEINDSIELIKETNKSKNLPAADIACFGDQFSLSGLLNSIPKNELNVVIKGEYNHETEKALSKLKSFPQAVIIVGESEFQHSYETLNLIKSHHYHEANLIYLCDTTDTNHILKVLKLGVKSIIFKREHTVEKVIANIISIINNEREFVYDDLIIKTMINSLTIDKSNSSLIQPPKNLTNRDTQIVKLLLQQKKLIEISEITGINLRTLEGVVKSIFAKFDCTNKTAFIIKAIRSGFSEE